MTATLLLCLLNFTNQFKQFLLRKKSLISFWSQLCHPMYRFFNHILLYENIIYFNFIPFIVRLCWRKCAKLKLGGKRCTVADANGLQESSYVWVISQDALESFDKRINKETV